LKRDLHYSSSSGPLTYGPALLGDSRAFEVTGISGRNEPLRVRLLKKLEFFITGVPHDYIQNPPKVGTPAS
jgi:hypothetical protein